ncbi:GFA family protein [Methylobacterium oryzisoli]|uniref:GFA family protein n=1 Tax=Methylobacterium oryzisoli TaxID=3385502 RepID=UPI003892BC58
MRPSDDRAASEAILLDRAGAKVRAGAGSHTGEAFMLRGGCHCGAVRYEADAAPFHATICHCADCRRIVGAASVAWFSVPRAALRWTAGAPKPVRSSARATRTFCGTCGTSLTYESDAAPDEIDVTTASLDEPERVPPRDHTFLAERLAWDVVADGLPTFARTR